jgi:hypothetical protein
VHFVTNFFLIFFPEFFVNFFFSFVNVQLMPLHEREGGKISVNWRSSCTVLGLQLDGNQVENLEKHILKQKKRKKRRTNIEWRKKKKENVVVLPKKERIRKHWETHPDIQTTPNI